MNLTLTRELLREDGVFSSLADESGVKIAEVLEHAYETDEINVFSPKLLAGTYTCRRGLHRLHGMANSFETFEVEGVGGHSGILFHCGNYNADSDGCLLVGATVQATKVGAQGPLMITNSRITFAKFMTLQENIDSFLLVVR